MHCINIEMEKEILFLFMTGYIAGITILAIGATIINKINKH